MRNCTGSCGGVGIRRNAGNVAAVICWGVVDRVVITNPIPRYTLSVVILEALSPMAVFLGWVKGIKSRIVHDDVVARGEVGVTGSVLVVGIIDTRHRRAGAARKHLHH